MKLWNKKSPNTSYLKVSVLTIILTLLCVFSLFAVTLEEWELHLREQGNTITGVRNTIISPNTEGIHFDRISPNVVKIIGAGKAYCLAYSHDGKKLAVGTSVGVEIYDESLSLKTRLITRGRVSDLDWAANNTIAIGTSDGSVLVWNVATGESNPLGMHEKFVLGIGITDNGNTVVSGSADKTVRLWNVTGGTSRNLYTHNNLVTCVDISSDGKYVTSGSYDNNVLLYNVVTSSLETIITHDNWVKCVQFSPDNTIVVSGGCDNKVRSYNIDNGNINRTGIHNGWVYGVDFTEDGFAVSGGGDKYMFVWDYTYLDDNVMEVGKFDEAINGLSIGRATGRIAFILGYNKVLVVNYKNAMQLVDTGTFGSTVDVGEINNSNRILNHYRGSIYSTAISSDQTKAVLGMSNGVILHQNLTTGEVKNISGAHQGFIYQVAFHPQGSNFASCASDGKVKIWVESGNMIKELTQHGSAVYSVAYSEDGNKLASGSVNRVIVWDYNTNQTSANITNISGYIIALDYASNGVLAIGTSEGNIYLVEPGSSSADKVLTLDDSVNSIYFGVNSTILAYGSSSGQVGIYDMQNNSEDEFGSNDIKVNAIATDRTGSFVVYGDDNGDVYFWPKTESAPILVNVHGSVVSSIFMDTNGNYVLTGSYDGTIRQIDLTKPSTFGVMEEGQAVATGITAPTTRDRMDWEVDLGIKVSGRPLVDANNLYIINENGGIVRVNKLNPQDKTNLFTVPDGSKIDSTSVMDDNTIYVDCMNGKVYAVDKESGAIKWNKDFTTVTMKQEIILVNGNLYIAGTNKVLYKVDAATGNVVWQYAADGVFYCSPLYYQNKIFIGNDDTNLYCINDSDGSLEWATSFGERIFSTKPAGYQDLVLVLSKPWGKVVAVNVNSGDEVWQYDVADPLHTIPIIGDKAFFGNKDGNIICINAASGSENWKVSIEGATYPRITTDGTFLYVTGGSNMLNTLDPNTGDIVWSFEGDGVTDTPVAIDDEAIYTVNDQSGELYRIWKETEL